jgi:hypothetical protein
VNRLRQQYLDLANREADWSQRYGPEHRAVTQMRDQMREIRNSISDELRRLAETYKSDFEISKQREEAIQLALAKVISQSQLTNQAQVKLRELESSAQTSRMLYDNMLQRYMESVQQQSFPVSEVRQITQATGPLKKSHPQNLPILAGSVISGLMLGFLLGVMSEIWRHVFRTRHEVNSRLQTNCIAIVPRNKSLIAKPERQGPRGTKHVGQNDRQRHGFSGVLDPPDVAFCGSTVRSNWRSIPARKRARTIIRSRPRCRAKVNPPSALRLPS